MHSSVSSPYELVRMNTELLANFVRRTEEMYT